MIRTSWNKEVPQNRFMRHCKFFSVLLVLCLLLTISGCKTETTKTTEATKATDSTQATNTTEATQAREPVTSLQCVRPTALNSLYPASGDRVVVSWADYDQECTTVLLVDVNRDVVCQEITLDGVWDLREQSFSDGRLALCQRETNTWKFLSASLEELGQWNAENVDGFFSYDGGTYYYLRDRMLYRQSASGGEGGKVTLPLDLRLLELTAFDAQRGTLAMQFFLSPYSSECGTAVYDMETGTLTMLQKERYRVAFRGDDVCLLSFDNEKMGYSLTYGGGGAFFFADAGIFSDTVSELYPVSGSPYLMGIAAGRSVLYAADPQITACPLSGSGIDGEMHVACYLPEEETLVGAVYQDGAFRLYVMDPAQLSFTEAAGATTTVSPFVVDDALAESYWGAGGAAVAESLQEARQYADTLEEKYSVHILLSSQCEEAAALCDMPITLTDTMTADEELDGIRATLEALDRSLALYPQGFPAQFRNGAGDGGLCFLLVAHIESNYNVIGCTYDRFGWQYIALDVNPSYSRDSVICHEMWHATENYIFSRDYTALPMEEWDALNPEGFSYTEYETRVDPTYPGLLYTSDPEDIHFVDNYGCVNRQEDRARIMEYFMTFEDEAQVLIQSPFIRQKLQMMCDAVRSVFDTTGWEDVRWERLL